MLRTLPGPARRRLPWRMRHPARWVLSLALLAAIVAVVLIAAADRAHRGAGVAPGIASHAGLEAVQLGQTAAHDYNPFGTGPENRDLDRATSIDGDPNTTWSTEQYYDDTLKKPGGVGLGIYLDAAPGCSPRRSRSRRRRPASPCRSTSADHLELGTALRQLHAAERARLAGAGRRERRRPQRRTHPAGARRAPAPLLPRVADHAAAGHGVGDDRRADAVQVTLTER